VADFYVAKDGSDDDPGTIGEPFLTVQFGIDALSSEDTLYIRVGTYTEGLHGIPNGSGTWGTATRITAYDNEAVVIDGEWEGYLFYCSSSQWIIFDGIEWDGTNGAVNDVLSIGNTANHIRFVDCEIHSTPWGGIIFKGDYNELIRCEIHDGCQSAERRGHGVYNKGNYTIIEDCEIYGFDGHGIHIFDNDDYSCHDNTVRGCLIHGNGLNRESYYSGGIPGIGVYYDDDNAIYNNIIYGESELGIQVGAAADGTLIYNNTVYNCGDYGIRLSEYIGSAGAPTNTVVRNNILYGNSTNYLDEGTDTVKDHNLETDPSFVNAGAQDFHIESGSDARDAGATIVLVADDYDDVARPEGSDYCIGAFEYLAGEALVDIDHEDGTTDEYDSVVTDEGKLSVEAGAALAGTNYGLQVVIDDATAKYGQIAVNVSTDVRVRFYIDPNGLAMADGDEFQVLASAQYYLVVYLIDDGGDYKIKFLCKDDAFGYHDFTSGAITDAPHYVEIKGYGHATAGTFELWVDGVSEGTLSGLNNDTAIDELLYLRMGAVAEIDSPGTSGTFFLDELVVNDTGDEIGPLSTVHELAADDTEAQSPVPGTPTIGQQHTLVASNMEAGAPVLGTPSLGQVHTLTATSLAAQAPVIESPTIEQIHALLASGVIADAPLVDSPVIGQEHILTSTGVVTQAPVLGVPILMQVHSLAANNIETQLPVLGTPVCMGYGEDEKNRLRRVRWQLITGV